MKRDEIVRDRRLQLCGKLIVIAIIRVGILMIGGGVVIWCDE